MSGLIHEKSNELTKKIASCFSAVPPEGKQALIKALMLLREHSSSLAEHQWRKHKAPMATYWKAISVWAGHIARAINKSPAGTHPLPHSDIVGYLATLSREDLLHHCNGLYNDNARLRRELDDMAGVIR